MYWSVIYIYRFIFIFFKWTVLIFLFLKSIHPDMFHPASEQWPSEADRAASTAGLQGNIIKAKRLKKYGGRQTATSRVRPRHLSSNQTPAAPPSKARKFVTTLSKSLWASLITSDFLHFPGPRPSIILLRLCYSSSCCHLLSVPSICVLYASNQRSNHLHTWNQLLLPSITI